MKQPKKPRILFYDLETSPMVTLAWERREADAAKVKRDTELLSFAWKWLGEKKVHVMTRPDFKPDSERELTNKLRDVLDEADVVIAHNGIKFDNRKSNAFMTKFKLTAARYPHAVDTCQEARKHFGFTSNSLEDLAIFLKLGKKVRTRGIDLWDDCMNSKPSAYRELAHYNKKDVVLLERVYKRLLSYMTSHPNIALMKGGMKDINGCPNCGSTKDVMSSGFRCTQRTVFREMRCLTEYQAFTRNSAKTRKNKFKGCGRVYKIPLNGKLPRAGK